MYASTISSLLTLKPLLICKMPEGTIVKKKKKEGEKEEGRRKKDDKK